MRQSKLLVINVLLLCLLSLSPVTFASDNQWHWIKVGNNVAHAWDVSSGDAEVAIKDGQLSAKLFAHGSTKDIQISLKGSIANGTIRVKETVHESDYGGSTYTGRLTNQKWKEIFDGSTGVETITLSDGFDMIGLTRTIKQ